MVARLRRAGAHKKHWQSITWSPAYAERAPISILFHENTLQTCYHQKLKMHLKLFVGGPAVGACSAPQTP